MRNIFWKENKDLKNYSSGGHDHNGNRNSYAGKLDFYTGMTDSSGRLTNIYTAGEFGGIEKIVVYLADDTTLRDTAEIIVAIPGLVLLPESPYYKKVGGTCEHHGPHTPWREPPTPPECQQPDHNHYIAPLTYLRLSRVCHLYYSITSHRLCINDISLPFGGLFDIDGNWRRPHGSHRMGVDIDIATRVVNEQGQVVGDVDRRLLEILVERYGGRIQNEVNHYHIRM
ncbi:hypothetical protein JGI20_00685 [Candidatus Kryptobacter tengchongensis]|nr:hypothetical protein JGI20_00685 [Candidatus Kryptobacter tengchongensis]